MKVLLMTLVVWVTAATLSASIGPPVDVGTRAKGAARVVVARVADAYSTFGTTRDGDQRILTQLQLQVDEVLKGTPASIIPVTIEGGTVGELTNRISDMPTMRVGERGVFFLDADGAGGHEPHRRGLGILKLDETDHVRGSELTLAQVRTMVRGAANGRGGVR